MTMNAIKKLSDKAKAFCEFEQKEIRRYNANGQRQFAIEEIRKLRGYLQCLKDMDCITFREMQALYIFYATM